MVSTVLVQVDAKHVNLLADLIMYLGSYTLMQAAKSSEGVATCRLGLMDASRSRQGCLATCAARMKAQVNPSLTAQDALQVLPSSWTGRHNG